MKKLLLASLTMISTVTAFSQCTELFFSEYVEGSGNDKGVEIYNPTGSSIDLSNYQFERYSNGSLTPSGGILALTGTVASDDVHVVVNGQTTVENGGTSPAVSPAMQAMADQLDGPYPAPSYFNGNDAMILSKDAGMVIVDIIGKVGEDPGASWTDDASAGYTDANGGTYWTKDQTLVRKSTVTAGVSSNPSLFNPTAEWDSLPKDTWTGLGSHTCDCSGTSISLKNSKKESFVLIFPNPSSENVVRLRATEIITSWNMIDITGKSVAGENQAVYSGNSVEVNCEMIPSGIYFIQVGLKSGKVVSRKYRKL